MIDYLHSTAASNLVASDIAKEWNTALTQGASGRRQSFRFANRAADYDELVRYLRSLSGPVQIGLGTHGRLSSADCVQAACARFPGRLHLIASRGAFSGSPLRHLGQERSEGYRSDDRHDGAGDGAGLLGLFVLRLS